MTATWERLTCEAPFTTEAGYGCWCSRALRHSGSHGCAHGQAPHV